MTRKRSIGLLYGGIAGGCMILFDTGTRLAGPSAFLGPEVYLVYLLLIAIAVVAALACRKRNGGRLDFREALRCCFTVFVVGLGLHVLYVWLLTNVIDPSFKPLLRQEVLAGTEKTYRRFGVPEEQIRQSLEAQRKEDPFSLSALVMGLAYYYIVFFLIALLVAALVRSKKTGSGTPER